MTGKTDILIRFEKHYVFVAECKIWKGPKNYLETIDQLFGYLGSLDSKAAMELFEGNKDFSSVLEVIATTTPKHPNYLSFVSKQQETWFNYRLHLNGDKNREVKVAVQLFHLPIPENE